MYNQAWLHHIVLLNAGPNVESCGVPVETIFMSGNERMVSEFGVPDSTIKSGYRLTSQDSFTLHTQLMNMDDVERWVWVTVTFDFLDGPQPQFRSGKAVFMSIGRSITSCGVDVPNPWVRAT